MKIRAFVVLCLSMGLLAGCQGPQRVAGPYEVYGPETEVAATRGYQTAAPYGAVGAGYGAPGIRRREHGPTEGSSSR